MAVYVFADFDAFKAQVSGAVSQSMTIESLQASILDAAELHLIPWLGQTMWDYLVEQIEADTLAAPHTTLLPLVQRALARLTLFEYSKEGSVQFNEMGLMRQESDSEGVVKGAYKYQETQYREHQRNKGYEALEKMLIHLEANSGDYPQWTTDSASTRNREYYINTAITFRTIFSFNISRYVFEVFRPVMREIETFTIIPCVGDDFHNELKAAILAKNATADQTTAIEHIQRAIVYFTILESIRREIVQHVGNAIVVKEKLEPQSHIREGSPNTMQLSATLRQMEEFGNRNLSVLIRMLDTNIANYPTYSAWKDAIAAAELAEAEESLDDDCNRRCGCGKYNCTCSSTTRKSVIRL